MNLADKHTALLLIDIQNDFCPGGALAVKAGDEIIAPVNNMIGRAENVIATQDWHPPAHSSFASSHVGKNPFDEIEASYEQQTFPQILWPDHCVQGSEGAEFHRELHTQTAQLILRKGYRSALDSYSAFCENDRKTSTGLDGYLQERRIHKLVIAGLATDYCVAFSALDAMALGYQVVVILPACRPIDHQDSLAKQTRSMQEAGITLLEHLI